MNESQFYLAHLFLLLATVAAYAIPRGRNVARGLVVLAAVALVSSIVVRGLGAGRIPLTTMYEFGILLGLVLTQVDRRPKVTGEVIDLIRGHYGDRVFKTEIPINVRLSEAPSFGQTIFGHDATSSGAVAYRRLAAEVLQRCRQDGKK